MAADSPYTPVVTQLGCLRGVSTLTAFGLATEIDVWGRSIGAYVELVPTSTPRVRHAPGAGSPRLATLQPIPQLSEGLPGGIGGFLRFW
jgi:hypothetical protein